jgi:DNA-binding SARP family transcriptional activator
MNPLIETQPHEDDMDEIDVLDALSNSVLDLIRSGQLDQAEEVCQQLLTRYPDQVDGLDRLALVYEAKGDRVRAADHYRKAADFMRLHPGFDEEGIAWMLSEAQRLDAEHEAGLDPSGPRCRG